MTGFSGMLSFEVKGGRAEATRLVEVREGSFESIVKKTLRNFFWFFSNFFVFYLVKKKEKKYFIRSDIGSILKVITSLSIFQSRNLSC